MDYGMEIRRVFLDDTQERMKLEEFLESEGIRLDKSLEYTVGIYEGEKLMATGSFYKNTLRCLAVSSDYQGLGVLNTVVSHLINEQYQRGYTDLYLYTKCNTANFFSYLGFYEVVKVDGLVTFMENKSDGIKKYVEALSNKKVEGESVGAIVMNANPFTLGHLHLIEQAAKENNVLHVFVVSEEASVIPFGVRYELIKRGTSHIKNVVFHKAGNYIISSSTFPSYFIKDENNVVEAHAKLDLEIFKRYIVPALGINKRYVGEEPYCEVTKSYNKIMKEVLEESGIQCKVIPRLAQEGKAISASLVRECIRNDEIEKIKQLVPRSTYEYFKSDEAKLLINKIKINSGRH